MDKLSIINARAAILPRSHSAKFQAFRSFHNPDETSRYWPTTKTYSSAPLLNGGSVPPIFSVILALRRSVPEKWVRRKKRAPTELTYDGPTESLNFSAQRNDPLDQMASFDAPVMRACYVTNRFAFAAFSVSKETVLIFSPTEEVDSRQSKKTERKSIAKRKSSSSFIVLLTRVQG